MNGSSNENNTAAVKKKKGRFNFIDLILILILVAVVATLIYVFSPESRIRDLFKDNEKKIQYTVEITNVDEKYIDLIKEGDVVGDSVTKSSIGKVEAVYAEGYTEFILEEATETNEEGTTVPKYSIGEREYPGKYNIIVTVVVTADFDENEGYTVNSTRIAVGEKMYLKFPGYVGEGYCIGIDKAK